MTSVKDSLFALASVWAFVQRSSAILTLRNGVFAKGFSFHKVSIIFLDAILGASPKLDVSVEHGAWIRCSAVEASVARAFDDFDVAAHQITPREKQASWCSARSIWR